MFDDSIGKWLGNNGDRYEGEWKDDKKHGEGKKQMITLWFIDSNIVWRFDRQVVLKWWRQIKASSNINLWRDMKDSSNLYESCYSK